MAVSRLGLRISLDPLCAIVQKLNTFAFLSGHAYKDLQRDFTWATPLLFTPLMLSSGKRLYEAAILELDPAKLLQRIAAAKERFLTKWKTAFQNHRIANNSPCTTRYTC